MCEKCKELLIVDEKPDQYIDTGVHPVQDINLKPNQNCAFCGYGNHIHINSVKLTSTEVEARVEITNEAIRIIDHKGASFEIKINYCPNCGAKMNTRKGDADD